MPDPNRVEAPEGPVVELVVEADDTIERRSEPVTCGVPWPRGDLRETSELALEDEAGTPVPLQARCLDRWPDGSIRWVLLDWQATATGRASYRVRRAVAAQATTSSPRVEVVTQANSIVEVSTGRATFSIGVGGEGLFRSVMVDGSEAIDPSGTRLSAEDGQGVTLQARPRSVEVLESGPVRSAVRVVGDLGYPKNRPDLRYTLDLHFFAGSSTVRFELTLLNPKKADHPGGFWSLGSGGSVYLKQASVTLRLPGGPGGSRASCSPARQVAARVSDGPIELYQDSSGGENWRSSNHVNKDRAIPLSFCGYRLREGSNEESGLRATPAASVERGGRVLSIAMEQFWQNFPKAIEAEAGVGELSLRIFPIQFADVHEIQGGEQKTHIFHVGFGNDLVSSGLMEWCRAPLQARANPDWYASTGAIPYLVPASDDPNEAYKKLVDAAIEGPDTFESKREVVDEYGWRHFGDVYGDHEAAFHDGPIPLVSHYNDQYDNVGGFALQFLRSGDRRWWAAMSELAMHVVDVDIYHTSEDKSAYNNGLFWHTCHYVDADVANHRTYPRASPVGGGGPSGGHNYTTGLMLHHFLTGDPRSRSAAIGLARWVIDMDDGRKAPFGRLDGSPHGHATASGSASYHGPGRAPANSLNALVDGHRLTGESEYLEKAEAIIRRCVHPLDDIAARDLLDAENKWFYTMFFQAIGRYLDHKEEQGSIDRMFRYARASLLHYARWMAIHEYPYLDKPEVLEFPTETWAAQDIRKADVFQFAAKHAGDAAERARFLERAGFFFEASTSTLLKLPSRTLARPVVLLLANGLMRAFFQRNPDHASTATAGSDPDFGSPTTFIPQKVRVLRKLKMLAVAGAIVGLIGVLGLIGLAMAWWG